MCAKLKGSLRIVFFAWKRASGAPGEIRTPDLLLRRQSLYPAELRARTDIFSLHPGIEAINRRRDVPTMATAGGFRPGFGQRLWGATVALALRDVYQRLRPPPPPPRPPRSRPPPPVRSIFGRASLTLRVRPPRCEPLRAAMTLSPS